MLFAVLKLLLYKIHFKFFTLIFFRRLPSDAPIISGISICFVIFSLKKKKSQLQSVARKPCPRVTSNSSFPQWSLPHLDLTNSHSLVLAHPRCCPVSSSSFCHRYLQHFACCLWANAAHVATLSRSLPRLFSVSPMVCHDSLQRHSLSQRATSSALPAAFSTASAQFVGACAHVQSEIQIQDTDTSAASASRVWS